MAVAAPLAAALTHPLHAASYIVSALSLVRSSLPERKRFKRDGLTFDPESH